MPHVPSLDAIALVVRAEIALGFTQEKLARTLGVSRRTITRWVAHESLPSNENLHTLARLVHPKDPALAAQLAAEGGQTLESLGIVRPAPAPAPAPAPVVVTVAAPPPPSRPFPPVPLLAESIVCAAADTNQSPPAAVRDILRAAFARARALGVTVEEVDDALSLAAPPVPSVAAALAAAPAPSAAPAPAPIPAPPATPSASATFAHASTPEAPAEPIKRRPKA